MAAKFNLKARIVRRRGSIVFRPIEATQAQASSLALIYLRVVKAWENATPAIVSSYEHTLGGLTTDAPSDTAGAIDSVAGQLQRLILMLTPDLRDWALRVEDVHRGKWIRNVLSAASVDLSSVLSLDDVVDTVEAALNWNVALVKDVNDDVRRKLANAVFSGFQARKSARDIAKEIRLATGMARQRSLRIAADQTVKLGAQLNQARQKQAGLDHYKWRHSGKVHPRQKHKERDGKIYPWEGEGSIAAEDRPGVPPYCGCTAQAVLVLSDENDSQKRAETVL